MDDTNTRHKQYFDEWSIYTGNVYLWIFCLWMSKISNIRLQNAFCTRPIRYHACHSTVCDPFLCSNLHTWSTIRTCSWLRPHSVIDLRPYKVISPKNLLLYFFLLQKRIDLLLSRFGLFLRCSKVFYNNIRRQYLQTWLGQKLPVWAYF